MIVFTAPTDRGAGRHRERLAGARQRGGGGGAAACCASETRRKPQKERACRLASIDSVLVMPADRGAGRHGERLAGARRGGGCGAAAAGCALGLPASGRPVGAGAAGSCGAAVAGRRLARAVHRGGAGVSGGRRKGNHSSIAGPNCMEGRVRAPRLVRFLKASA